MARMLEAAARSDFFVLNGDVFDFRWTTLPTVEETVRAALDWLRDFATAHPQCQILYVMGNHDNLQLFADRLAELSAELSNFRWHPSHLWLGKALFLHGDLVFDWGRQTSPFRRMLSPTVRKRSKALRHAQHVLHKMRIHRWHAPMFHRRRCAGKILRSIDHHSPEMAGSVAHVYFGHTHLTFSGYTHRGVTFHNSGSAIKGLPYRILRVQVNVEGGLAKSA